MRKSRHRRNVIKEWDQTFLFSSYAYAAAEEEEAFSPMNLESDVFVLFSYIFSLGLLFAIHL